MMMGAWVVANTIAQIVLAPQGANDVVELANRMVK